MVRPVVFVGSAAEHVRVAQAVQVALDPVCDVELWTQDVFLPGRCPVESLVAATARVDFAILVLSAADLLDSRGRTRPVVRESVLFEAGLFVGALGRERTFLMADRSRWPALPADLAGISLATFRPHRSGNLIAAVGAACTVIATRCERIGPRCRAARR